MLIFDSPEDFVEKAQAYYGLTVTEQETSRGAADKNYRRYDVVSPTGVRMMTFGVSKDPGENTWSVGSMGPWADYKF